MNDAVPRLKEFSRIFFALILVAAVFPDSSTQAEEGLADVPGLSTDLALLESENIVFSASKRLEAVNTAPLAVSIVTSDQIETIPARYIPQLLRLLPGVDVIQITRTEFTVGIRGFANGSNFRPRDVLVLVDGRTIYDDFSGNIEWEIFDFFPQDVSKIEVIRGGGSAIHGANAARGVINIMTRPPQAVSPAESDTTVASQSAFRQRLATGFAVGPYTLEFSGGFDQADLWNRFENVTLSDPQGEQTWRLHSVAARPLPGGAELRAGGGINRGQLLQHTTSGTLVDNHQTTGHLTLEYEHPALSVRSFWNSRNVDKFEVNTGDLVSDKSENLYDLEVVHRSAHLGRSDLSLGGDVRQDIVKASDLGVDEVSQFSGGIFADERFNVTDQFLVRLAGRLDYHEETNWQFSPRAGLTYQFLPEHTLRASISLGYRTPTISNTFFDFPLGPGFQLVGNPDLKSEESLWYELGYLWQSTSNLTLGLDGYYVITENLIRSTFQPPTTFTFINDPEDTTGGGGELWGEYRPRPWLHVIANYSYARFRRGSSEIDLTAPHKANAGILVNLPERMTGAVTVHFVGPTSSPFTFGGGPQATTEVDSYVLVNTSIGYHLAPAVNVRIDAFNVTNNRHREIPPVGEELPFELSAMLQVRM